MQRKNTRTKSVGNGEGSLYYSKKLKCWVFQYYNTQGKRQTMKQKKKETVKDFKARVTTTKNKLNNGTYIEKRDDTVYSIIEEHIKQIKLNSCNDRKSKRENERKVLKLYDRFIH